MIYEVKRETLTSVPVDKTEIARYAGARSTVPELFALIENCLSECERENAINYAVCYALLPLAVSGNTADFSVFKLESKDLVKALRGAKSALVFACTVGFNIDRLIKKYSETDPARALVFQAIGAERVESFTDEFLKEYAKDNGVKLSPRFSAGYGDLPLSAQKDIFALLRPQKMIGITLNDSLLMSPSKSVTAIVGIGGKACGKTPCSACGKTDCEFRR